MPIEETHPPELRRAMGFRDLLLFYVVTGFSLRWISTAAAAGPSAVVIWIGTCLAFYIPLMLCVLELSTRFPDEGGIYVWAKRAFGPFSGFLTGWTYWACNLPYYPALLYFTAGNALYLFGARWQHLSAEPAYFIIFSLIGLVLAAGLNVVGLNVGKWLHNAGAIGLWIPAMILMGMGALAYLRFGSATSFGHRAMVPSTHLKDIIFWSTIAFSMSGVEGASVLGDEIEDARRMIPRALLIAGVLITLVYILSTVALIVALPPGQIGEIQGIIDAIANVAHRLGVPGVVVITAFFIVLGGVGQAGAWFAASARLPFVAGIDHLLPPAFGKLHPRFGTPHVALVVQAVIAAIFIFLGQAGTSVKGAYDVLVSTTIVAYFIPYLFMFAALIRMQWWPAPEGTIRIPGGAPVAVCVGVLGLASTSLSIVLACIPAGDEPNKTLAVTKVVGLSVALLVVGVLLYGTARLKQWQRPAAYAAGPGD